MGSVSQSERDKLLSYWNWLKENSDQRGLRRYNPILDNNKKIKRLSVFLNSKMNYSETARSLNVSPTLIRSDVAYLDRSMRVSQKGREWQRREEFNEQAYLVQANRKAVI